MRLRRGSGAARGMVWCGVGGIRGQGLGCLGRQAGFGEPAETRETGKGREPGDRLGRDPSGKPGSHSIGNSEESFCFSLLRPRWIQQMTANVCAYSTGFKLAGDLGNTPKRVPLVKVASFEL